MVNKQREKKAKDLVKYYIGTKENLKNVSVIADHYREGEIKTIRSAKTMINNLTGRGTGQQKVKSKIQELTDKKREHIRDHHIELDVSLKVSALNDKVKNITIKPKSIGIKAASDFKNVIVKAFNQALNKVGNDKMYSVVASITIFGEEGQPVHATSKPCKNHTNQTEFNNWLSHFMDRIMIIMQSLDITKLKEFYLKFNFNFIEIPTGAGSHATQDRTTTTILKKSVIKIVNNDNNCFFHALAVK
jgi:hypothetical protein